MPKMSGYAVCLLLTLTAIPTNAQTQDSTEKQATKFYEQQYAGWGGIILRCLYEKDSKAGKRICANIKTDAEFLATAAKVPFYAVKGDNYFEVAMAQGSRGKIPNGLVLEADVITTRSDYLGAAVRLEVGSHYSNAVDKFAKDGPETMPKGGTLVLWDNWLVASGPNNNEFFTNVRDGTETLLKQFLTNFVQHWKNPNTKK